MRAQDQHPYDSTILGLENLYIIDSEGNFYINSDCILATDKTITIGKPYIVFDTPTETGVKMSDVTLIDCYYYEGMINLIVRNIRSQRIYTISHCLECPKTQCTWILVDLDYFIDRINTQAIEDYCGCTNNKKKPIGESKKKFT